MTDFLAELLPGVDWASLLAVTALVSLLMVVASLVVLPWILIRLPADYLLRDHAPRRVENLQQRVVHVLRNTLAILVGIAGVLMLVLPGQGLLTILSAAVLSDLPGKRRIVRAILGRRGVLRAVNALRRRAGRPPLVGHGDAARTGT